MPTLPTLSVAHEVRAIAQDEPQRGNYPGDGSQCECCGLGLDAEQAACGHWFCYVCRNRGHDADCDGEAGHSRQIDGAAKQLTGGTRS